MEPKILFKLITELEDNLSEFYAKLKNVSSLNEYVKIFELMEQQSEGHSKKIRNNAEISNVKPLDSQPIYQLHNEIKKSLFNKVTKQSDTKNALKILAESEEIIGQMYQSISNYYRKLAGSYLKLADNLDEIAKDEFKHRDAILKKI